MASLRERHTEASKSEVARQAILNFLLGLADNVDAAPPGTAPGIGQHIMCEYRAGGGGVQAGYAHVVDI